MSEPKSDDGEATDFRKLPVLAYYEERRTYPRVDLRIPVLLTTAAKEVFKARVRNISADGLQLRCDAATAKALHPAGTQIGPGKGPTVTFMMELPTASGGQAFGAIGRLTYITARRPGEVAFGVQFTRIEVEDKAVLAAFIMESLRPA